MTATSIDTVNSDQEILDFVERIDPELVAIVPRSASLRGENHLKNEMRTFPTQHHELIESGDHPGSFPITLGPMRMLTARGVGLKKIFTGADTLS